MWSQTNPNIDLRHAPRPNPMLRTSDTASSQQQRFGWSSQSWTFGARRTCWSWPREQPASPRRRHPPGCHGPWCIQADEGHWCFRKVGVSLHKVNLVGGLKEPSVQTQKDMCLMIGLRRDIQRCKLQKWGLRKKKCCKKIYSPNWRTHVPRDQPLVCCLISFCWDRMNVNEYHCHLYSQGTLGPLKYSCNLCLDDTCYSIAQALTCRKVLIKRLHRL